MTLDRPWLLLLLTLVPLTAWLARRSRARLPARRNALAVALRALALTALILGLAGFAAGAQGPTVTIFAIDTSESVLLSEQAGAIDSIQSFVDAFGADQAIGVVQFAERAAVLAAPGRLEEAPALRAGIPRDGTDIGAGLASALSLIPPDARGRLVLFTDGNDTRGSLDSSLQAAVARGIPVAVAPVRSLRGTDLAIDALNVPANVREGATVEARITVRSDRRTDARLRLWDGDRLLSDGVVRVNPGAHAFVVDLTGLEPGFHRLRVELLEDADLRLANNVAEAFLRVARPGAVLSVGAAGSLAPAAQVLLDQGLAVSGVDPADLASIDLGRFDAVLLSDVPAGALGEESMQRLREYVRLGHGLIVMGGDNSYAAGAYEGTPLDEALPVWSNPTQDRPEPRLALVLIIDKSSSMETFVTNDLAKIDLAREAAVAAVELLQEGDILGVLAFDKDSQWVVPPRALESAGDLASVAQRIRSIRTGSTTDIYRAMFIARSRLLQVDASIKHVVLLTDGKSRNGDFDALTRSMRRRNITVSTIAIGEDADQDLLRSIARLGNGRYYFAPDPTALPQVLTQETRIAGDFAIVERDFQPRLIGPSPILGGALQGLEFPELAGFVRTRAKPTAEVVLASDSNDPVLAQWQFGRGRAVAWTSDAGAVWARRWASWPGFATFVRQAADWVMPPPGASAAGGLIVFSEVEDGRGVVTIDSVDAQDRYRNRLSTTVQLVAPDGAGQSVAAVQVGPGRYLARLPALPPGVYELLIEQREGGRLVAEAGSGLVVPVSEEARRGTTDNAVLRRIASTTGGALIQEPADLARLALREGGGPQLGWPLLLTLGLLLYVADVGVRRVRGSRREVLEQLRERVKSLRAGPRVLRRLHIPFPRRR